MQVEILIGLFGILFALIVVGWVKFAIYKSNKQRAARRPKAEKQRVNLRSVDYVALESLKLGIAASSKGFDLSDLKAHADHQSGSSSALTYRTAQQPAH